MTATWYPVALSADLPAGSSTGIHISGREVVIWRDRDGAAHAWEDRCPHRGMRLSLGFVRGDQIACLYHGWHYDTAGQCRFIPAHPQLTPPGTIRVDAYACAERVGMVWVSLEPEAAALPEEQPATPVRSIAIATRAGAVAAALAPWGAAVSPFGPIAISADGDDIIAGLQPLDADTCMLHLSIPPGGDERARRHRVNAWAERLRTAVEAA